VVNRGLVLTEIEDVPRNSLLLLAGSPGAGKSMFCHRIMLNAVAIDRPVIYVTTECGVGEVMTHLREKGLHKLAPGVLSFVDAFGETVGVSTSDRPDTVTANCEDLNSISIAITKLEQKVGRRDILLVLDSLTSPYLFNMDEIFRFMRQCLLKFAARENSVVVLVDEGCGRKEDLVAMMSVADMVVRVQRNECQQLLNVTKHPQGRLATIEVPLEPQPTVKSAFERFRSIVCINPDLMKKGIKSMSGADQAAMRSEVKDFVNLFWPSFAHWSVMLWDPIGFPKLIYEINKEDGAFSVSRVMHAFIPWRYRIGFRLLPFLQATGLIPKTYSRVKDMRRLGRGPWDVTPALERSGKVEYLEKVSRTDEHHFRIYESSDCWGFDNVGTTMAWYLPPHIAGQLTEFDCGGKHWNAIETKCIGLGDPYCEFKLVPEETDELWSSLEKDASVVERIHERLMDRLLGFLLDGHPLVDRPSFGSDVHLHPVMHGFGFPYLALDERYRMALRMGGARAGKKTGERLMDAGLSADQAVQDVVQFMEHCKVGKVTLRPSSGQSLGATIRIRENCENTVGGISIAERREPGCLFTTGFLNGLFSMVKNQHVREVKCIAAGDPYCEWEIV
jgi:predicted hydrocarbon binding protein/KaiC/GvpD/RAD55 family RecA-like ATPase